MRALEAAGYINRYVTLLDPKRVGLTVSVLVQVTLEKQIEPALQTFEKAVRERPEVMEFLSRVPGVGNIKSSFALKQVKYQTALPLPAKEATVGTTRKSRKR